MIERISSNVWKVYFSNFGSNCYLIKIDRKNILIDTSSEDNRAALKKELKELGLNPSEVDTVLMTHFHFDHSGNLAMFRHAKVYASEKEIAELQSNPVLATLSVSGKALKELRIIPVEEFQSEQIKIIPVPGHTRGSIAFYMPSERILFSGDTIFDEGIGRVDLPTSQPEKMEESVKRLKGIHYKILCAGH